MKIAAGVLTHNVYDYGRQDLLRETLQSLADCPQVYVVDNGSTDGTEEWVRRIGGIAVSDPITTCGHGMNVTCRILAESGADICVFSNDDISWKSGWMGVLKRFWSEAPDDLIICSGLLEEDFPWNTVRERIECGGIPALVRDTAPGGAWTFRARDWPKISPIPEAAGWDDVPVCKRLRNKRKRVAQMDLARHLGQGHSTWDNSSVQYETPLDRDKWGNLDPFATMS